MNKNIILATALALAVFAGNRSWSAEIIGDNYNVIGNGTGFDLDTGVNTGINPPATRLTGSASVDMRYIVRATARAASDYSITDNSLQVASGSGSGRFTFSKDGITPYDFSSDLGSVAATPANPAVYEITISMANNAAGTQRFSFGIATEENNANFWDFGIQLFRGDAADDFYSIRKRLDAASITAGAPSGGGTGDINATITTTAPGTWGSQIDFLIRVTDAGAEPAPSINSRIQISMDGGATWFYDTATDPDLVNGFCFDASSRFFSWDIAGSAVATYDNFSVTFISGPNPMDRTWAGAGGDDNWSTGANWAGGVAPAIGDSLIFNGTTRQANVNDITDLVVPSLTFNNGGFTLSGNPLNVAGGINNLAGINTFAQDLVWSSTAVKPWNINAESEVVLNNNTSIEVNGDHTINGGGALLLKGSMSIGQSTTVTPAFILNEGRHIVDGGTFISRGGYRIGSQTAGIGAQTILINGANFSLTVSGANLRVGDSGNSVPAELQIDNSTLTMAGGSMGIPYADNATGIVTQNGGTVSGAIVAFNDSGAGTGTYTIHNGILEPVQIRKDTAGGTSSIYFDNATLRSGGVANSAAFFSGVDVAEIQGGGLTLDAQADVTIAQPLSGTGNLVKNNFAAVTLTGANTFSGNTLVQQGKLVFPNIQTNSTTVLVSDGAEFGVAQVKVGSTLSVPTLNFTGTSFGTMSFDLRTFGTPTAPLMKVSNLSASGPVTINISGGLQLSTGQIVLVDYDGAIGGGFQFTLGTLPDGMEAELVNNTANGSIDLNITGVPGLRWSGANGSDWDYGTENWINRQNGLPTAYFDNFPVQFLDGAATGFINLSIYPLPSALVVSNNTLPYVWSGGALTTASLKKFGTNSLTRTGGEADLITGIELNAGAYIVSNFYDATFASVLTDVGTAGNGAFVKQGASTLTVSSTNTSYDGAIVVQEGTLKLGDSDALGSVNKGTTIANGATLDLNNIVVPHEPVIVSGNGVGGLGAIIDSTTATGVAANLTDVTLAGDTTFGSPNGGRWDLRVRTGTGPDTGLKGNGFNLTKVGSGSVSIACQRHFNANQQPYWEMNLGDVAIQAGSLTFAESLTLGNPSKIITIADGAQLGTYDLNATNPILRNIYMTNATISSGGGAGDTNMFNGAISVTGTAEFKPANTVMIINGAITGTGSVTVNSTGVGTLYLNGNNTYPGDTTVNSGTLGGIGVIAGNLTVTEGLAPGYVGVGKLTVNGNVTLGSSTTMELDRSKTPNSDELVVGGALNLGGTLNVVLAGATPQAGDVYQLFNKVGTGGFSAVNLPDLSDLPGDLAWDSSKLMVNGTLTVTGTATPPTIGSVQMSGGNFVFSGAGGVEGAEYVVLSSTNIALPVANWTPVATNTFGPGGTFSYTNAVSAEAAETFFLLQIP
jgi:autotransporter-associated beta strand protein